MPRQSVEDPRREVVRFRAAFHALIRRFGLLDTAQTPCGQPLSVTQAHALMELLHRGTLRQGELAAVLGLSKSAVSRLVRGLERHAWVTRTPDPEDGRARRLALSVKGRRLARRLDQASLERFGTMIARVAPEQRAQLHAVLEALHAAIPEPPVPPSSDGR
jgi:DNA-binding MarR family transcriptional regulator